MTIVVGHVLVLHSSVVGVAPRPKQRLRFVLRIPHNYFVTPQRPFSRPNRPIALRCCFLLKTQSW